MVSQGEIPQGQIPVENDDFFVERVGERAFYVPKLIEVYHPYGRKKMRGSFHLIPGTGAVIAESARVDPSAYIGDMTIIGAQTEIAENVWIEDGVLIGERVKIDPNVRIEFDAVIGSKVFIETTCVVKNNATIDRGSILRVGTRVENNARVGRNVILGEGTTVLPEVQIFAGSHVPPGSVVSQ